MILQRVCKFMIARTQRRWVANSFRTIRTYLFNRRNRKCRKTSLISFTNTRFSKEQLIYKISGFLNFNFVLSVLLLVCTVQMHVFGLIHKNSLFLFLNTTKTHRKNKTETHRAKKKTMHLCQKPLFLVQLMRIIIKIIQWSI